MMDSYSEGERYLVVKVEYAWKVSSESSKAHKSSVRRNMNIAAHWHEAASGEAVGSPLHAP